MQKRHFGPKREFTFTLVLATVAFVVMLAHLVRQAEHHGGQLPVAMLALVVWVAAAGALGFWLDRCVSQYRKQRRCQAAPNRPVR